MAESSVEREIAVAGETAGEVRLWQAVVVRAIEDWMSGPLRQRRQADYYIFVDKDFVRVCQCAGLDANNLRVRLSRMRSRHSQDERPLAA